VSGHILDCLIPSTAFGQISNEGVSVVVKSSLYARPTVVSPQSDGGGNWKKGSTVLVLSVTFSVDAAAIRLPTQLRQVVIRTSKLDTFKKRH
jgi:hypothetical protein